MSRDQKPAKMRVIAGGAAPSHPLNRAGDLGPASSPLTAPADPPGTGRPVLMALVYVAGCAVGGVAFAMLLRTFAQ